MEPEAYLQSKVAPPPTIPDLDKLIAPSYERYDFGGMGAFDVFLLARQYAPKTDAKDYYSHWRGGYYLAARAKTAPKDQIALHLSFALGLTRGGGSIREALQQLCSHALSLGSGRNGW